MNIMRIVILPQEQGKAPLCLTMDDSGTTAWRRLHPGEAWDGGPTTLVVPGIEVSARWLHLPTRHAAQALAAARLQWDDESALPSEALHLALGPLEEDGHRLAVAVARERLQSWLEDARQAGVVPDLVIPDHLALPEPLDGETQAARMPDGTAIVRGPRLAFACEIDMLPALLGERPVKSLDPTLAARLMAQAVRHPAINLLQGAFAARRSEWHRDRRMLRIAILAGLLLLSPFLLRLGEGLVLHFAAQGLRSDSVAAAAQIAPGKDPVASLAERARRVDLAGGGGPASAMAQLLAALEAHADLQLEGMTVQDDGAVTAMLRHASPAELEALAASLRTRGVAMTVAASRPDAGRTVSDIKLGGAS
jgi:general secretion pathway protein L